jgi:hypothetical protein
MAEITSAKIQLAQQVAVRTNKLGELVYSIAQALFWILTVGVVIGLYVVYNSNTYDEYGDGYTQWDNVWVAWGALVGVWMIYAFALAMIALVGAVAQAKAQSLEIQILQAQD